MKGFNLTGRKLKSTCILKNNEFTFFCGDLISDRFIPSVKTLLASSRTAVLTISKKLCNSSHSTSHPQFFVR